jgi:hypothetical protein
MELVRCDFARWRVKGVALAGVREARVGECCCDRFGRQVGVSGVIIFFNEGHSLRTA